MVDLWSGCDTEKEEQYRLVENMVEEKNIRDENVDEIPYINVNKCLGTYRDILLYQDFANHPNDLIREPANFQKFNDLEDPPRLDVLCFATYQEFFNSPTQMTIFQAITCKSSNDYVDLERLETLGDSFLKFAASITIAHKLPFKDEAVWTPIKGKLVGNNNLSCCAAQFELGSYLKVDKFLPSRNWCPPGFCVPQFIKDLVRDKNYQHHDMAACNIPQEEQITGKLSRETKDKLAQDMKIHKLQEHSLVLPENKLTAFIGKQTISDKSVADCVEAIIGSYVLTSGIMGGFEVLRWLGVLTNHCPTYKEICESKCFSTSFSMDKILHRLSNYKNIENTLGYRFNNKYLLVQAFTHPTYTSSHNTDSYQRLEFIGDAVLDFLITLHIYQHCGNLNPGELTDLRSSLVNNVTFASFIVRLGFHKELLHNSPKLFSAIDYFAEHQQQNSHKIGTEILMLSTEVPQIQNLPESLTEEFDECIQEGMDVPKALGDLFESIAGAIYIDCGKDLQVVWKVFYAIMKNEIINFSKCVPKNPVRLMYELNLNMRGRTFLLDGISNMVFVAKYIKNGDEITKCYGVGQNKQAAQKAVAKLILRKFNYALKKKIICN